jgi:spore coat protein U-like protein
MKLTKLFLALVSVSTLVVGYDTAANAAAKKSAAITVQANVVADCTISAAPIIEFGDYDPLATADKSSTSGSVTITCSKGASVTIGLTGGDNFDSGYNRMKGPTGEFLRYLLFQPSGSPQWSDSVSATGVPGGTGSVLSVIGGGTTPNPPYGIVGTLPQGQDVSIGAYTDTIYAFVNF